MGQLSKEQLRLLMAATTVADARVARVVLAEYVRGADMAETTKLMRTLDR
jgi:hypothetical protein